MRFFVYSRPAVESIAPHDVPHVIVSITTVAHDQARLPTNGHTLEVLRLSFPDADGAVAPWREEDLFSPSHANAVWDLVERHREAIEHLVVHCDAGQSRSQAVAAAISRALLGEDEAFFARSHPNRRVYSTLLQVFVDRGGVLAERRR